MSRIEIHIDRLVLRGVPGELAEGIGPLLERLLGELATAERRGEPAPSWAAAPVRREQAVTDREGLGARVARDIWTATRSQVNEGVPR